MSIGRLWRLVFGQAALLAFSSLALAQDSKSTEGGSDKNGLATVISEPRKILGRLNDHGIPFQGLLVYDWSKEFDDEADPASGFGRYSLDLFMPIDGKKAFGLEGGAGLVRLKQHMRQFGETYEAAEQVYSNIDASSRTILYEIWYEQRLFSNKLRLKGGKIDANTEFAVVQNAGDFLNSSMGYSPTIMAFPTYPEPKPGINVFLRPTTNSGLGLGVFQTAGNGTLTMIEPGHSWNLGQGEHPGRISAGYWLLNRRIDQFDGGHASSTQGFYTVVEQSGWRHPWMGNKGERKLSTFFQLGHAEGQVSSFTHHIGGGAVLQAPFTRRDKDSFGIAATWLKFSSAPTAGFDYGSELILESYYKASVRKYLAVIQDFQFLHHPGGEREERDGPVITTRLVLSF